MFLKSFIKLSVTTASIFTDMLLKAAQFIWIQNTQRSSAFVWLYCKCKLFINKIQKSKSSLYKRGYMMKNNVIREFESHVCSLINIFRRLFEITLNFIKTCYIHYLEDLL